MKNKYFILMGVLLAVACTLVAAPSLPEFYEGYASLSGVLAPVNTSVIVRVNGSGEVVGNSSVYGSNGFYYMQIIFDIPETNETDEGADSGDLLVWYVNNSQADRPVPANDTAESGKVNDFFIVSVGETPLKIVNYTPSSLNPIVNENSSITFTVTAIGPVNSTLTYNWTVDGVMQSNSSSLVYSSGVGENGTKNITIKVSNDSASETQSWNLTVNVRPTITPTVPDIVTKSNTITDFNLTPYESDYEDSGVGLNWSVSGDNPLIATVSIDPATDILTVIPRPDVCAIDYVVLTLTDSKGGTDTQEVAIVIEPKCSGIDAPVSGDWNITSNTSCSNVNITLSEGSNLNVIGNVTLVFDNVTLILDNGSIVAYDEGGSDSTIQSIINTIIEWIT